MNYNISNRRHVINRNQLFGVIFSLLTCLSFAHAQENLPAHQSNISDDQAFKILQNPQNENHAELVMFVLKSIEDLNITDTNKKLEFVDTLEVSDQVKNQVKSYINQNISYSDNEKVSYGIYQFKKCNQSSSKTNINTPQIKYHDYIPRGGACYSHPFYDCIKGSAS